MPVPVMSGTRTCLVALCSLVIACAEDRVSPSADGSGGRPGPDAGELDRPDAAPPPARMFAHSDEVLYAVDDVSFDLVEIGPFNLPGFEDMNDLAVTPDGLIFGLTANRLYRIDAATGAASFVAAVSGTSNVGMTFLPDGDLLAADKAGRVRRINAQTGAVTELGHYGGRYSTAGDLVAVADGTMYTIVDDGPNGNEWQNNALLKIDPATGAHRATVGAIGFNGVWGAAYANGNVYAFTSGGEIIEIDRTTGAGTLVRRHPGVAFYGAAVTPLVNVE
jgi:outer membrane protein assembly factor BamB